MGNQEILDEALGVLQVTQEQLSLRYLGKSHGYVSSIRAQKRDASTSAMSNLRQRLRLVVDSFGKQSLPEIDALLKLLEATEQALMRQAVHVCHSKMSASRKSRKPRC